MYFNPLNLNVNFNYPVQPSKFEKIAKIQNWNWMMADICWMLKREAPEENRKRKSNPLRT